MQTPEEVAREVLGCHLIDTDGGPGLPDFTCETTGHDQWDCAVEEERLTDLIRARDAEVRADERKGLSDPILRAWVEPGPGINPPYHERMKARVRKIMPTLARHLDEKAKDARRASP